MKVIINGRKYDTETARLLGEVMNENASIGCPVFDNLYRKKTGEFFRYLWREFYGSEIVPLTEQEARESMAAILRPMASTTWTVTPLPACL